MNPKSGKAGKAVSPAAPSSAEDADDADPGKVAKVKKEQAESGQGKYGSTKAKPKAKPHKPDEEKTSWIEIELVDEEDNPVPGERYEITVPDGTVASGTLDENGFARVDGIDPGTCQVTFPELDKSAWEPA